MSGFFGQGRLGRGTGGSCRALLGMSISMYLDDISGFDLPGVTPGPLPEVTPGSFPELAPGHALSGGRDITFGGGGGGGFFIAPPELDDLLLAPASGSVSPLQYGGGGPRRRVGDDTHKHANATGVRLAVTKMACG